MFVMIIRFALSTVNHIDIVPIRGLYVYPKMRSEKKEKTDVIYMLTLKAQNISPQTFYVLFTMRAFVLDLCNRCEIKQAEIFQDDGNYCLECWQDVIYPRIESGTVEGLANLIDEPIS